MNRFYSPGQAVPFGSHWTSSADNSGAAPSWNGVSRWTFRDETPARSMTVPTICKSLTISKICSRPPSGATPAIHAGGVPMKTQAPPVQPSYAYPAPPPRKKRRWLGIGAGLAWIPGFAIPWGDMIQLPYDIQASRVIPVLVFVGWLLSLLRSRKLRRPDGIQILMVLFAALAGMSGLWSVEVEL